MLGLGCSSDAPLYAACGDDVGCEEPADRCWHVELVRSDGSPGEGAICTARCENDADCPGAGVCLALAGDPDETFLCWSPCDESVDCYFGLRCTMVEGADGVDRICLP